MQQPLRGCSDSNHDPQTQLCFANPQALGQTQEALAAVAHLQILLLIVTEINGNHIYCTSASARHF